MLAGIALGLQSYDTEHYTVSLLLLSAGYLFFNLLLSRNRAALKNWLLLALGQSAAVSLSALLYLPVLLAARREIADHGDYVSFPVRDTYPGADLLSFIYPHGTSGFLTRTFRPMVENFAATETSFLGWTVLALAMVGIWRFRKERQVWFWTITALAFAALALGPYPRINGDMYHIAGPYMLLQKMPLLNSTRVPVRFTLIAMLSVCVLAGYGMSAIYNQLKALRWTRQLLPGMAMWMLVLLFIEFRPATVLTSTEVPPIYEAIANSAIPGSVATVPLGWDVTPSGSGREMTFVQLYQPVHMRPLVGGMVARAPKERSVQGVYSPVLDFLADPLTYDPTGVDENQEAINRAMDKYQIAFIVVHKTAPDVYFGGRLLDRYLVTDAEMVQKLDRYIVSFLGMEKFDETDEYVGYRRK